MTENTQIKLFEDKKVRTLWDKESEEWYFSVVDVVAVLTESKETSVQASRIVSPITIPLIIKSSKTISS